MKLRKAHFLLTFVFIISMRSWACPNIDLRNDNLGSVRDQKEVSWCYAFSSADLLNYYFPREQISAADIAVHYNRLTIPKYMRYFSSWYNMFFNWRRYQMQHMTGFSKLALNLALYEGSCAESDFPSEKWIKVNHFNGTKEEVLLDQAMVDIHNLRLKINKGLTFNEMPYYFELSNITPQLFYEIVKNYTRDRIFNVLRTYACQDSRRPYGENYYARMVLKSKSILNKIFNKLTNGDPVLVDYDIRVLHELDPRGLKIGKLHTSVVAGSRFNSSKNACEILIKDSFGKDCSQYASDIDCENGYIWIDAKKLKAKMTSFVYLDH